MAFIEDAREVTAVDVIFAAVIWEIRNSSISPSENLLFKRYSIFTDKVAALPEHRDCCAFARIPCVGDSPAPSVLPRSSAFVSRTRPPPPQNHFRQSSSVRQYIDADYSHFIHVVEPRLRDSTSSLPRSSLSQLLRREADVTQ